MGLIQELEVTEHECPGVTWDQGGQDCGRDGPQENMEARRENWEFFLNSHILESKEAALCHGLPSTEMSWMAKRRMMVQIIPKVIFALPSTISAQGTEGRGREGS